MEQYLLPDEQLLTSTPNNVVVLTTHRLRYDSLNTAHPRLTSMMLEKVSACEVLYYSQPLLLILGGIMLFLAGMAAVNNLAGPGFMVGVVSVVMIVMYFTGRKHVVVVSADSGAKITFETKGIGTGAVVSFINSIENAKNQRLMTLNQQGLRVG